MAKFEIQPDGGEDRKKFEIQNGGGGGKKFQIKNKKFEIQIEKPKFEIQSESNQSDLPREKAGFSIQFTSDYPELPNMPDLSHLPDVPGVPISPRDGRWFHQENSNDCGPCLILNILNQFGVHTASSIQEVRSQVNQLREGSEPRRPQLNSDDWFTSEDVGEYLSKIAGLNVEEYICFKNSENANLYAIYESLIKEPYDALYTTSGSHFTGIVNTEGEEIYMNSFLNSPLAVDANRRQKEIVGTVFSKNRNRTEVVGIVRRDTGAEYKRMSL